MSPMNLKRIFLSPPHMSGMELPFIHEAFDSNYIAPLGPSVDGFEHEFSKMTGITHTLAVSSGTAAMHLTLRHLNVGPQDEVIASSLTFIGSVSPAVMLGARPVFIDSDMSSWNMDPDLLQEEVESCLKKNRRPKAIIPTDLYGQSADLDRIVKIGKQFDIPVISDSAEAVGASYKGRHAGSGATAAIFSFNGNKIITTSGGGMLASENKELIDHARCLAQQARDPAPHYEHSEIGFNYRMSNVLAAIGRAQLKVLPERVLAKRKIFDFYKESLGGLKGIEFMPEADYGSSNRWLTVILVDPVLFGADREEIRLALEKRNIESRPVWKPMHLQPVFKGCRIRGGAICEDLFRKGLCLPSGTAMTQNDLEKVVETIANTKH